MLCHCLAIAVIRGYIRLVISQYDYHFTKQAYWTYRIYIVIICYFSETIFWISHFFFGFLRSEDHVIHWTSVVGSLCAADVLLVDPAC